MTGVTRNIDIYHSKVQKGQSLNFDKLTKVSFSQWVAWTMQVLLLFKSHPQDNSKHRIHKIRIRGTANKKLMC